MGGKGLGIKPLSNKIVFSNYIDRGNGIRCITGKEIDVTDEAIYCVYEWMKKKLEKDKKNTTQELTFRDKYTMVMFRTSEYNKIMKKLNAKRRNKNENNKM